MVKETLIAISLITNISLTSLGVTPSAQPTQQNQTILATHTLDLTNRLTNYQTGSQIFADNILLSLHYLKGDVQELKVSNDSSRQARTISGPDDIDWDKVREPFEVSFVLKPGQVFAFHNDVLKEFKETNYTMNSRFYAEEGYKSLGGLGGNGVCHLASLINWAAQDVGLESIARVNHDFYPVPGVPQKYGVSIFYAPQGSNSAEQNLYIKNNFEVPVDFKFKADSKKIELKVLKNQVDVIAYKI